MIESPPPVGAAGPPSGRDDATRRERTDVLGLGAWLAAAAERRLPDPPLASAEETRRATLLVGACLVLAWLAVPMWALTAWLDRPLGPTALAFLLGVPAVLANPALLRRTRSVARVGALLMMELVGALAVMIFHNGGFESAALLWLVPLPLVAMLLLGRRLAAATVVGVALVAAGFCAAALAGYHFPRPLAEPAMLVWRCIGIVSAAAFAGALAVLFERLRHEASARAEHAVRLLEANNAELALARDAAQSANRARLRFLANTSHQLRTPLTAVLASADLVVADNLSDEQLAHLNTVRRSVQLLVGVFDDILEFAQLDSGRLNLDLTDVDVRGCVEDCLEVAWCLAAGRAIDVGYIVAPGTPEHFRLDAMRLRQVLTSLVGNAVRATDSRQVLVEVAVAEAAGRRELLVRVRDSGAGFDAAALARVFEPFDGFDATRPSGDAGTGLGLALSRRIVERMGGHMGVESTRGEGTTFWFSLPERDEGGRARVVGAPGDARVGAPADAPTRLGAPGEAAARAGALAGRVALVADGSALSRRVVAAMLEAMGARVVTAATLRECTAGGPFDVLVVACDSTGAAVAPGGALVGGVADGALGGAGRVHEERGGAAGALAATLVVAPGWAFSRLARGERIEGERRLRRPLRFAALERAVRSLGAVGPRAAAAGADGAPAPVSAGFDGGLAARSPLRVLLVDDNADNRFVLARMLGRFGFAADVVDGGEAACAAARAVAYDLIFMDVQMPDVDGLEATRRIRAERRARARGGAPGGAGEAEAGATSGDGASGRGEARAWRALSAAAAGVSASGGVRDAVGGGVRDAAGGGAHDAARGGAHDAAREPFIVALTAGALKGDRDACFEAGMDAFMAKPLSAVQLGDMLARVAGLRHPGRAAA